MYCFTRCVTYFYIRWLPSCTAAGAALLLAHAVLLTVLLTVLLPFLLSAAALQSVLLAALLTAMLMLLVGCKLLPS